MSMTPEEKRAYDDHMDNIMVQNDVLDTARDEGRAEERVKIIRSMHENGIDDTTIAGVVILPIEKVREILSSRRGG